MFDRGDGDLHYEGITPGAAMAFENLVGFLSDLYDVAVVDRRDAHSHKRRDRQPDPCRIDLGSVAGDDAGIFQLANALDDSWGRQPDATAELGIARLRVLLQLS